MAAAAIAGVGTAMSMQGAQQQGQAGQAAAQYNYQVNQQNAKLAIEQAASEEQKLRVSGQKSLGAARANYGASGVQMDASALDVLEESAKNIEMDALEVRHKGALKAWSYQANAGLNLLEGEASARAGSMGAATALVKGAGAVYDAYDSKKGKK